MDKKQIGEKLKSLKGLLPAGHLVGAGLSFQWKETTAISRKSMGDPGP